MNKNCANPKCTNKSNEGKFIDDFCDSCYAEMFGNRRFVTNTASFDEIVMHLISGLTTDGAHHKQYYLEKIFRILCEDEYIDEVRKEFGWEEGIPD
jgi:hypothetical protein